MARAQGRYQITASIGPQWWQAPPDGIGAGTG
jgi:hypothetical protein